ncbi:PAAR domain-containing protein [Lysobacter arvi]|uniref:PAAR domain-containing protein n=1 Tax=Lysobacter arvi TaxID=3038776 RepID=A0ABU1CE42_9GAMM|nr:PAAR domain-containing protein [Lysobacter arvi]MDR0183466.1 PAAR domain-containing protein [Lysobacter arvi]
MSRPLIVKGDITDHGGTVQEGHACSIVSGKAVATVGMKVACPIHGDTTITTGSGWLTLDGRQAATHGDHTSCGASLISSQTLASIA